MKMHLHKYFVSTFTISLLLLTACVIADEVTLSGDLLGGLGIQPIGVAYMNNGNSFALFHAQYGVRFNKKDYGPGYYVLRLDVDLKPQLLYPLINGSSYHGIYAVSNSEVILAMAFTGEVQCGGSTVSGSKDHITNAMATYEIGVDSWTCKNISIYASKQCTWEPPSTAFVKVDDKYQLHLISQCSSPPNAYHAYEEIQDLITTNSEQSNTDSLAITHISFLYDDSTLYMALVGAVTAGGPRQYKFGKGDEVSVNNETRPFAALFVSGSEQLAERLLLQTGELEAYAVAVLQGNPKPAMLLAAKTSKGAKLYVYPNINGDDDNESSGSVEIEGVITDIQFHTITQRKILVSVAGESIKCPFSQSSCQFRPNRDLAVFLLHIQDNFRLRFQEWYVRPAIGNDDLEKGVIATKVNTEQNKVFMLATVGTDTLSVMKAAVFQLPTDGPSPPPPPPPPVTPPTPKPSPTPTPTPQPTPSPTPKPPPSPAPNPTPSPAPTPTSPPTSSSPQPDTSTDPPTTPVPSLVPKSSDTTVPKAVDESSNNWAFTLIILVIVLGAAGFFGYRYWYLRRGNESLIIPQTRNASEETEFY